MRVAVIGAWFSHGLIVKALAANLILMAGVTLSCLGGMAPMDYVDPTDCPLPASFLVTGTAILSICAAYCLTTLLYVTPNNALRICFDAQLTTFERWGYQKWTFFAPPPEFNSRLYFAFSPKNGDGITVEVLEGIYERKQKDSPRNGKAQIVDYVVSGAAGQISDIIHEIYRYRKVHELFDGDPAYLEDVAKTALDPETVTGSAVKVLLNYAAMVATEQGIELDGLKCQMAFSYVPLRPFSQRYNSDVRTEENMIYRTAILDIPKGGN